MHYFYTTSVSLFLMLHKQPPLGAQRHVISQNGGSSLIHSYGDADKGDSLVCHNESVNDKDLCVLNNTLA